MGQGCCGGGVLWGRVLWGRGAVGEGCCRGGVLWGRGTVGEECCWEGEGRSEKGVCDVIPSAVTYPRSALFVLTCMQLSLSHTLSFLSQAILLSLAALGGHTGPFN